MNKLLCLLCSASLAGCGSIAAIGTGAGAMPVHQRPSYNSPEQVIYRIDEHRYITLENYRDCRVGGIMKWHDDRNNLHVVMSRYKGGGRGFWPGKFSIEPSDERFAVPSFGCGDKACYLTVVFTNDGGLTWDTFVGEQYSIYAYMDDGSRQDAIHTDVRVTKDGYIYVVPWHKRFYYRKHLDGTKNQRLEGVSIDERCVLERSPGMSIQEHLEMEQSCEESRPRKAPFSPLPSGKFDKYDLASIPEIKTPSGQQRFTCDPSLNPVAADDD
jgi:hypothetical protein